MVMKHYIPVQRNVYVSDDYLLVYSATIYIYIYMEVQYWTIGVRIATFSEIIHTEVKI